MLINELFDKKLKKPFEVKIEKLYIVENEDLEIYGEGDTEEKAIEDFKYACLDLYENFLIDEPYTDGGDEYKDKFLAYFQLDDHPKY